MWKKGWNNQTRPLCTIPDAKENRLIIITLAW